MNRGRISYKPHAWQRWLAGLASVATVIYGAISLLSSDSQTSFVRRSFEALWPWPIVIFAFVAVLIWIAYREWTLRRAHELSESDSTHDQAVLDGIMGLLDRELLSRIEYQDYYLSWPADLTRPIRTYLLQMHGPEFAFVSRSLEASRAEMYAAADRFLEVEAMNGWPDRLDDRFRCVGWTSGEIEFLEFAEPEKFAIAENRREVIADASANFVRSHYALVEAAKAAAFSLDALRTPKVQAAI